jgi:hypothetical protein
MDALLEHQVLLTMQNVKPVLEHSLDKLPLLLNSGELVLNSQEVSKTQRTD